MRLPETTWGWIFWWLGIGMIFGIFPPLAILCAVVILVKYVARETARANQEKQLP